MRSRATSGARPPSAAAWFVGGGLLVCLAAASAAEAGAVPALERAMLVLAVGSLVVIACHTDPAWLAAGGICLTVFSGNWEHLGLQVPIDRVLLLAAGAGAVGRHLGQPPGRAPILRPVHAWLAAAALAAIASAVWAGTLSDPDTRFALLDRFGLVPFAMFVLAPLIFPEARDRAILLGALVMTGAYLGLTALFETFDVDSLVWPKYILDPAVGIHADRARGPFVEAAANGMGLFACGAAAAVALATWRRPAGRVAAGIVVLLSAAGLLFTLTRSIWLGSAVAIVLAMAIGAPLRRFLIPVLAGLALAVVATFALVPSFADRAQDRQQDERPVWDRKNLNAAGLRMVADRPLIGFGFGKGGDKSIEFVEQADEIPLTSASVKIHNAFLKLFVDTGLVGGLLWVAAFASTVGSAMVRRVPAELRPWQLALIAVVVQGLVVQNLVPGSFVFPILITWTVAGMLGAPRRDNLVTEAHV